LDAEPGITVLNDVVLNQVVVCFGEGDKRDGLTKAVIARVYSDGVLFAAGAQWCGGWAMRLSVSSGETEEADIDVSAAAIIAAWKAVSKGQS
jgi:hypothetical protein